MVERRALTIEEQQALRVWALRHEEAENPNAYVTVEVGDYVDAEGAITYCAQIRAERRARLEDVIGERSGEGSSPG